MTSKNEQLIERAKHCLLQNYKQQPLVLDRGEGVRVWDVDGRAYLDMLGGIATCVMGHGHAGVIAAAKAQLDRLWHTSNVFYAEPPILLAEKLTKEAGLERAFFCNSGAEANEALIKLARRYPKDVGHPERFEVITFDNSFHGRTLATVTATGQPKYQKGFEPLPTGFRHLPYGNLEAVQQAIRPETAAILIEPIQGEGGVRSAPAGFLRALRELCDAKGLLLLIDEVQTGMGRTGKMFAYQHEGIRPDGISLAKALANGLPMGAMLCSEKVAGALPSGTHGSTFGGNPVAAAAANVVVDYVSQPAVLAANVSKGERFIAGVRALSGKLPGRIVEARGKGLLLGVELAEDAAPRVARLRESGLLCNLAGERTLRFAPAFVISEAEIDEALRILGQALS
ncbi:MAG: aspartate aminotransferase family protein [Myxococcaceae bacterium]